MIQKLLAIACVVLLYSCVETTPAAVGKWYTYAESGDYMELWIGENHAMSYLSSIDEFLIYDVDRVNDRVSFSLLESRVIDRHQFELVVLSRQDQVMKTIFLSESRVDSLKSYFLVEEEIPKIGPSLKANQSNMEDLLSRMEGSHASHGH